MVNERESGARPSGTGPLGAVSQGNGRERLELASGQLLVIDQFMLGNEQFVERVKGLNPADSEDLAGIRTAVQMYGGCLLELPCGEYEVLRDPEQAVMALRPLLANSVAEEEEADLQAVLEFKGNLSPAHHVFVDTRCLVFVDAAILKDQSRLGEYRQLREAGDDKRARDYIRENGGAVRYGFNRYGDELGVFKLPDSSTVALWPDVVG